MPPQAEVLGTLIPVGGGDPIPLLKPELTSAGGVVAISGSISRTSRASTAPSG